MIVQQVFEHYHRQGELAVLELYKQHGSAGLAVDRGCLDP
jgi:hypothetical protein